MKKSFALLLSVVLVLGVVAGSSLAWLTATDEPVVNVFTDSNIDITLTETDTDPNTDDIQHNYKMIPGWTIPKDPMVTLDKDSEACYLFIKVEENLGSWSDNGKSFTDYLSYSIDDTVWTATGQTGIYYKEVDTANLTGAQADLTFKIIENDTITVSGENVTKEMMDEIDGEDVAAGTTEEKPTLTFKAAAVQLYEAQGKKFDVTAALAKVEWPTSTP